MTLGVLGGTFDPVHIGHLLFAERAREQLGLERVLWVPAGNPWRKRARKVSAAEQRLEMVRLAIQGNGAFELCAIEMERSGPSYTGETLEALRRRYGNGEWILLLGGDALVDLPNWREPGKLLELATLAVVRRGGQVLVELEALLPGLSKRVVWVDMPRIDISGTELRRRAAAGQSIRYAVPAEVEAYIRRERLYM